MHPLCEAGLHVFPLVDRERFQAAEDPFWHSFGNCRRCGNTMKDPGASGDQVAGRCPSAATEKQESADSVGALATDRLAR